MWHDTLLSRKLAAKALTRKLLVCVLQAEAKVSPVTPCDGMQQYNMGIS